MPLTLGKTQFGQNSNDSFVGDAIWIEEAEIKKVEDESGKDVEMKDGNTFRNDLRVNVELILTGPGWEANFSTGGNLKKGTGGKSNWGGAFKVRDFFQACLEDSDFEPALPEMEKGIIPKSLLAKAEGKKVFVLRYKTKQGKTKTWNQVASTDTEKTDFKEYFQNSVSKGWTRIDYDPHYSSNSVSKPNNKQMNGPWDEKPEQSQLNVSGLDSEDLTTL